MSTIYDGAMQSVPHDLNAPSLPSRSSENKPKDARERILDAALREFSEHGWGGGRVDRIAAGAQINKRMLYAYVGNKQALWLAVLEHVYVTMRQGETALSLQTIAPETGIQLLIRYNCRFHADHPEFISMLNEENRQKARNLSVSKRFPEMYLPLLQTISDLHKRGIAAGVFRADIDPKQLYITIASLSYFYFSNIHTLSTVLDEDFTTPQAVLSREQHIVDVVMGYLRCSP